MRYTVRPLSDRTWLGTMGKEPTRFSAKWTSTEALLLDEIGYLKGRDVVIETDITEGDLKLNGELRSDAKPTSPAVVVAFESRHGPMLHRCDRFHAAYYHQGEDWHHNARAIALTLQALRAVDRYGATQTGQQYTGFKALGAGLAPFQEWLHAPILRGLERAKNEWARQYLGGNLYCSWNAWATWFREDGPAIGWADGWGIYSWHGTQVPADLIEEGWDTTRILKETNAEVRRCAIERLGWDRFVDDAGLKQVGETVPDPGNPGQTLALYDVPEQIYDEPVRVLIAQNGTCERDGSRRTYGLTVPGSIPDPVAASAWTFGLNPSEYRTLERAT